jgi:hypothetical protein
LPIQLSLSRLILGLTEFLGMHSERLLSMFNDYLKNEKLTEKRKGRLLINGQKSE